MRLSKFILSNLEEILSEWESFASTVLPENKFENLVLRDEAEEILKAIAIDMETAQTTSEQAEKSKGAAPVQNRTALRNYMPLIVFVWGLIRSKWCRNIALFAQRLFGSGSTAHLRSTIPLWMN